MSDIPAGWQPDPRGRHEYRYWDGTQWTDHVSDQGNVSEDPVADTGPAAEAAAPAASDPASIEIQPTVARSTVPEPEPAPEPVAAEATPEPVVPDPEPVVVEPVATPEAVASEPAPTEATTPASSGPPTSSATVPPGQTAVPATAQTEAKAAAQDMLHSKSPELATILSVIAPGSGHFYLGTNKPQLAGGLLAATVAAVVLAYMSFILFIVGLVIWIAAAVFAITDLRGGVESLQSISLPPNAVGLLLIGAGALMIIGLFLPWYTGDGATISGLRVLTIIDLVLLLVGVAAIVAGAASLGLGPVTAAELPRQLPLVVAVGGAVAAVLILFRMFVLPGPGDSSIGRGFGLLLDMDAALVIVLANVGILRSLAASRT